MKRLMTILTALVLVGSLSAQEYKMRVTDANGQQIENRGEIFFLDNDLVVIPAYISNEEENFYGWVYDTIPAQQLHLVDFLTKGGRSWELNYAPIIYSSSNPTDYGYASALQIRNLMTEDVTTLSSGYNWYSRVLEADMRPNIALTYIPWYFYLDAIMQCSDIIRAIGDHAQTPDTKAILAEAYITRAMLNLDFARMYEFLPNEKTKGLTSAGVDVTGLTVPIVDENVQTVAYAYSAPRATKAEMVGFISRDLIMAESLVANITTDSHEVPHADVIAGLRARLALWNGDYKDAAEYAARAIAKTATRPMTSEEMLSTTRGFNDISLWMWGVQQTEDKNQNGEYANFTSWLSFEYDFGYGPLSPPMIGRSLYNRISDEDPRKLLFLAPYTSSLYGQTPLINRGYYPQEMISVKFRPAEGKTTVIEGAYTAYPLMRVEEMYFIQAEAMAYSNPAAALKILQDFMQTYRYQSYAFSSTDRDELIQEIILQKRIELWGEGQTFFDVKRLNMSVTRDYEGTNFYAASAFNTTGRPWWMNMTLPSNAANTNMALYGYDNPQDSVIMPQVMPSFQIQRPAFLKDFDALPVDSVYGFLLHFVIPDTLKAQSGSLEISIDPGFALGKTKELMSVYLEEDECSVNAYSLWQSLKALAELNNQPSTGEVTAYLRAKVNNALSTTFPLSVIMPEEYMGNYSQFSYMPRLKVSPVGVINCEEMAGMDKVKVANLALQGEGSFYSSYYSKAYIGSFTFADRRDNFTIDAQGFTDNTYYGFNDNVMFAYREVLNRSAESYTFGDGFIYCGLQRNDLITRIYSDSVSISLKFNMQQAAEETYSWTKVFEDVFTSAFNAEMTGKKVVIQQAQEETGLYRIVEPYQRGHNLMFREALTGGYTLSKQMAYYNETDGGIYVEGTGEKFDDEYFVFTLTFTTAAGQVLGTFQEQVGEKSVWRSLGKGTLEEYFVFGASGEVEILACENHPERYRVVAPFDNVAAISQTQLDGNQAAFLDLKILQIGDNLNGVSITQSDLVSYPTTNTGYYHPSYNADIEVIHPSEFSSARYEYLFYYNRVLGYCDDGKTPGQIQLAPYYYMEGVGGWNYSQYEHVFIITFPGYEIPPYTLEKISLQDDMEWSVVMTGIFKSQINATEKETSLMKGKCTIDEEGINDRLLEAYGQAYCIASPYAEGYNLYFFVQEDESGRHIVVPEDFGLTLQATGLKDVTGTVIYAKINAAESAFSESEVSLNITFMNVDGTKEYGTYNEVLSTEYKWKQVATGTYYYLMFSDNEDGSPEAETGYELFQREDKEEVFKIANWLMGTDFIFTWDQTTNRCVVEEQAINYEHPAYGPMYIYEGSLYNSSRYGENTSYYDPATRTFHFFICYYVSAGSFGCVEETFVLDTQSQTLKHVASRRIDPQQLNHHPLIASPTPRRLPVKSYRRKALPDKNAPAVPLLPGDSSTAM